jgi:hypothetical protein
LVGDSNMISHPRRVGVHVTMSTAAHLQLEALPAHSLALRCERWHRVLRRWARLRDGCHGQRVRRVHCLRAPAALRDRVPAPPREAPPMLVRCRWCWL